MKDVIKKLLCTTVVLVLLFGGAVCAHAQENTDEDNIINQQLEIFETDKLIDALPDDTKEILSKSGIDTITPKTVTESSVFDFFSNMLDLFKSQLTLPIQLLVRVVSVILICSLITSVLHFNSGSASNLFTIIGVLCVSVTIIGPITNVIERTVLDIGKSGEFMLAFIPVFSGIMATSGAVTSAGFYSGIMLGVINIMLQVTINVIVPIIGIYFGFCMVGSINDTISVQGIISTFKTTILWALGFVFTIFIGIMSLQGVITSTGDTMAIKTAKFMFGSFIPIIGATISEAFNSIQGCVGVIKSTVGAFGIISIALIYLPLIINLWIMICALKISSACCSKSC